MPIFRSRHQADQLTLLFLQPDREYTLTEWAERSGGPLTTLQREAGRLEEAGILAGRRVGRARLIRAAVPGRYARSLTELLTLAFGPHVLVQEEIAEMPGVDGLAIFGSWASRYRGEPGPLPRDIDVLVIGNLSRGEVYEAAERVEERLGIPVNPILMPFERWNEAADPLVEQIRASAVVWVKDLPEEAG